jgi:hypothetical protein
VINYKAVVNQSFFIDDQSIALSASQNLFDTESIVNQIGKNKDKSFVVNNVFHILKKEIYFQQT